MKITLLLAVSLLAAVLWALNARTRRAAREAADAAALARSRAAARRSRVPTVSNNLKGVTATQTFEPYRKPVEDDRDDEERAA